MILQENRLCEDLNDLIPPVPQENCAGLLAEDRRRRLMGGFRE